MERSKDAVPTYGLDTRVECFVKYMQLFVVVQRSMEKCNKSFKVTVLCMVFFFSLKTRNLITVVP